MIKERVYFVFKHCEPGKDVMRVKWGRWMKGLFCVEHWVDWVDYAEFDV